MKNKYKLTGFTRLLIFLILFSPIAYIGANYYQGEDGIEKIKILLGRTQDIDTEISKKKQEIKKIEEKLQRSKEELSNLENKK